MSDREYLKSIVDIIPEDKIGEVIQYMMNISDDEYDKEKFELVSKHILEKYREAFKELAK